MKRITIEFSNHSITIEHDGKTGAISASSLSQGYDPGEPQCTAIDAIESIILAHAVAGVDVQAPAYVKGIETALDAIVNHVD